MQLTLLNDVVEAVPTAVPIPDDRRRDRPAAANGTAADPAVPLTPEQAEALIPDELLQQIQRVHLRRPGGPSDAAPPCRRPAPFDVGGETHAEPARDRAAPGVVAWSAAAARAGRVLAGVQMLALVGAGLALWRLSPTAATDTLVGSGSRRRAGDRRRARAVRRRGGLRARARRTAAAGAHRRPRPAARARGLPVGQRAAPVPRRQAARRRAVRGRWRGPSRCGWSTGRGRSSTRRWRRYRAAAARRARARRRPSGRSEAARRAGAPQGRSEAEARRLGKEAESSSAREFASELLGLNASTGWT